MDPTSLLGTLSTAINRHQELKNELRRMEKKCEHLQRVHLLWISYFNKTTENSIVDDVDNFEASFDRNASEESFDKNVSHSSSDNKLNRFSQRIKRILSNKPDDSKCLRSSQPPNKALKVVNGTFSRSKSEDETSKSLSPSAFLVSEISKQMCGHHGFKLEGLALDQEAKKTAKGRKSTSLSIDPRSETIKCSRRASCHVVTSSEYFSWNPTFRRSTEMTLRNEDHSRNSESPNKRLSFPETLKCALKQTNAFLPVFQPQAPISSRHVSPLATLHEEMVAQWIGCDDFSGTSSCRSKFSDDDLFHQTDDDVTRFHNFGDQFNRSDSRCTPEQDEIELSKASHDLQADSCLSMEGTRGSSEGMIDNHYNKDHEKSPHLKVSKSNKRSPENAATKEGIKAPISFEISPPTHQVNFDGFDENTPSSIKVHEDFNTKCSRLRCNEAVARFSFQVISLKEQLKITKLKISFLNDLLNSRMEWVGNSCIGKTNSFTFTFLKEMKVLRRIFKTHVDELLKELNEQVEPVNEEQESKLKDLEEFFQSVVLHGVVSPKIIIFCISRLLDLFHLKFSQMKKCLSRKDLMLQSLESSLLVEQVTNKLLYYEKRSFKRRRNVKKHCEDHGASSDTTFEMLKGFQHEKEINCIEASQTLESELQKLISTADKSNCHLQVQRESSPLDTAVHKSSSDHSQQSPIDFPMKSREEFRDRHEDADSTPKITEISKEEDLSSNDHLKSGDGEFLYEFSLNDLLVDQETIGIKNIPEKKVKQLNTTNEGKRNNLSIFRPSIKKSDWVIREAKLPYFEIRSLNKDIHKTGDLRKKGTKLETKRGSIPTKLENSSCPTGTSELQQDCLSAPLSISYALNKSDPIKDHTEEREPDISDQVSHGRPDRNSFDMWTCMEGYIRSPSPEKCDRSAKRSSESSRRSSKMLLNKISPNKSPLNICKNLCLVNGQSGSFDDDGTK